MHSPAQALEPGSSSTIDASEAASAAPASPSPSSRLARVFTGRRGRFLLTLAVILGALAAVNVLRKFGPVNTGLIAGPVVAVGLIVLARRHGLTWHDLGLGRKSLVRGLLYAAASVVTVLGVYMIGVAIPFTRVAFLDVRYHLAPQTAALTAFVIIPLGTILVEEVAFRGVLFALVRRHRGLKWASIGSSVLFGVWHVLPSLNLNNSNAFVSEVFGNGSGAKLLVLLAVVAFTALAGLLLCELRRRSGSLLAAAGLHWATNGLGVIFIAGIWSLAG